METNNNGLPVISSIDIQNIDEDFINIDAEEEILGSACDFYEA